MAKLGIKEVLTGAALALLPGQSSAEQEHFDKAAAKEACYLQAFKMRVALETAIRDSEIHFRSWDEVPQNAYDRIKKACMTKKAAAHCDPEAKKVWETQESATLMSDPALEQATASAAEAIRARCMSEVSGD